MGESEDKKQSKIKPHHIGISLGAISSGVWTYFDPETVSRMLRGAWEHEFFRMTAAFTLAAWMHRNWVRKDMGEHFSTITAAINNVANKLSDDLQAHGQRIDKLENSVNGLSQRVDTLEKH